eukprot:tig00000042_g15457.t1
MATADARELLRASLSQRSEKIDSPLVKNGSCVVCKEPIKTQAEWLAHASSRAHRQRIEALQQKKAQMQAKQAMPPPPAAKQAMPPPPPPAKRSSPEAGPASDGSDAKRSRAAPPSAGLSVLAAYEDDDGSDEEEDEEDEEAATARLAFEMAKARAAAAAAAAAEAAAKPAPAAPGKPALPAGFFDDKEADARARGEETPEERMAKELAEFQKAMRGAELEAQEVREADLEEEYEEREADEAIEQERLASQVDRLKQSAAELKARLQAARDARPAVSVGEEDLEGEEDADDLLDWRRKRI